MAIAVAAPYLAPMVVGAAASLGVTVSVAVATAVVAATLSIGLSVAFMALGVGAPSAMRSTGPPTIFRQSFSNSFIVYGQRRVGGLITFFHSLQGSTGAHFRYFLISVAGHECQGVVQYMLNDEVVTVDGSQMVTSGKYAGNAWLEFDEGGATPAALQATFIAETWGKWTSAHRGNGIAKIFAKFKLTDDLVEAGLPNITAVIQGKNDILDPRTGTRGYTNNAVLVCYDWLQIPREEGGFGAYADEIPDAAWISAQANVCDEVVSGEARYALDGVITTGAEPAEVRDAMIVNMAGTYAYSGGKHLIRPGYYVAPSATLGEDDLAAAIQVSPFAAADAAANEVQGTFIDPASNWQGAPFTTQTLSPAPDDVRQTDLDLAFITSINRANRVARIMLNRAQHEKTVVWPGNIALLGVAALDTVQLSSSRYGLDNYAWQVTSWSLSADWGVVLQLREEAADIYDPPTAVTPTPPPPISPGDPILTQAETTQLIMQSYVQFLTFSIADTGNITISNHVRVYPDKSQNINGATVTHATGATAGDIEAVYYDDPTRGGTGTSYTPTYQVLRLPGGIGDLSQAQASPTNPYRHLVCVGTVPASGGTTSGGSDEGSGGGVPTGYGGPGSIP